MHLPVCKTSLTRYESGKQCSLFLIFLLMIKFQAYMTTHTTMETCNDKVCYGKQIPCFVRVVGLWTSPSGSVSNIICLVYNQKNSRKLDLLCPSLTIFYLVVYPSWCLLEPSFHRFDYIFNWSFKLYGRRSIVGNVVQRSMIWMEIVVTNFFNCKKNIQSD